MLDLFQIFVDYGAPAGIIAVLFASNVAYALRDRRTITRLERRVKTLEDERYADTASMLARCENALTAATEAILQNGRLIEKLLVDR
jgi:hypothetical protein